MAASETAARSAAPPRRQEREAPDGCSLGLEHGEVLELEQCVGAPRQEAAEVGLDRPRHALARRRLGGGEGGDSCSDPSSSSSSSSSSSR